MPTKEQLKERADKVLDLLLQNFEDILNEPKDLHPTDRATIARFLKDNNFRIDADDAQTELQQLVADIHARRRNGTPRILPDPNVVPPKP
jgi:hypothetical protein